MGCKGEHGLRYGAAFGESTLILKIKTGRRRSAVKLCDKPLADIVS